MEPFSWINQCLFGEAAVAARFDALDESDHTADIERWTLPDGRPVTIRPIRAADLALELAFVRGLSRESRYSRLMSARNLSMAELVRLTDVDGMHEFALIATTRSGNTTEQIGVARYVMVDDGGRAEFAIVIADAWQGIGLGEKLLRNLLAVAGRQGVQEVTGITLSTNRRLIDLARKLGFVLRADPGDATVLYLSKALARATVPA